MNQKTDLMIAPLAAMNWMNSLGRHYEAKRRDRPDASLIVACDIDGTIIDMRRVVLSLLQSYDRAHGTDWFARLDISYIAVHENQIELLLDELALGPADRKSVMDWYRVHLWDDNTVENYHHAFRGVLSMIRWFQIHPDTEVALVSGRPEALRDVTLRSLNNLGAPYRVRFSSDMLFMNPEGWGRRVAPAKVEALDRLRSMGHHVFAMIDNEPAVLEALGLARPGSDLLLLHADTIFESRATSPEAGAAMVGGDDYEMSELVLSEHDLPKQVDLIWHGVNDAANLDEFVASEIKWAEVDVRQDSTGELILRHDSFKTTPPLADESWLKFETAVATIKRQCKGIKLDLKVGGEVLDKALAALQRLEFSDDDLYFNGNIEAIGEAGFRKIATQHPNAIIQCPIDWIRPLLWAASEEAKKILDLLSSWGINRLSITWERVDVRELMARLDAWGHEVNIYNVKDLEDFLEAVVLLPRSVTADFNFPQWDHFGRGSGKSGILINYPVDSNRAVS